MTERRDHFVYRLFDVADELLYVGCTRRPTERWREHRTDRPYMTDQVKSVRMQGPYARTVARRIEREAIRNENPAYGWTPQRAQQVRIRNQWIEGRLAMLRDQGMWTQAAIHAVCQEAELRFPGVSYTNQPRLTSPVTYRRHMNRKEQAA
jgi:predicted GIY-YIG superfamily endonuclease